MRMSSLPSVAPPWVGFPHVLSARQFDRVTVEGLFERAQSMALHLGHDDARAGLRARLPGDIMLTLFYEPSTRTRFSFESAALHLGMAVISTENAREFSSAVKGESLEDTIRVVRGYHPRVIVLRHHEAGAAERAARSSNGVPIVNAGDGNNEHPTQTLLDLYTIFRERGSLDGLRIVMGGDLANGRTVRSLAMLLTEFRDVSMAFVSPEELSPREDMRRYLAEHGVPFQEFSSIAKAFSEFRPDVVYWTRVQKERFIPFFIAAGMEEDRAKQEAEALYAAVKDGFVIGVEELALLPRQSIVMHPLPRNNEIPRAVDADPRAAYFRQAAYGLPVRMALLDWILG